MPATQTTMTSPLHFSVVIPPAASCIRSTQWHAPFTCVRGAFGTPLEAIQWAKKNLEGNSFTVRAYRVMESRKIA